MLSHVTSDLTGFENLLGLDRVYLKEIYKSQVRTRGEARGSTYRNLIAHTQRYPIILKNMNLIDKLLPVITLILGWGLSEIGKFSTNRKNDRKKLKKLLFNLLELRWLIKRELDLNKEINIYIEKLKVKLLDTLGPEAVAGAELVKPMIYEILKDKLVDQNRIKEIEANIDFTINELAEIHPVFAYELSGSKIKKRLENAESYFNEVSELIENMPVELTNWIQPKLSHELLTELDNNIIEIAKKVNWKTKNVVSKKISMNNDDNYDEMDKFIDEYIERIKTMPTLYSFNVVQTSQVFETC